LEKNSDTFVRLQGELYTTQILNVGSQTYREFVTKDVISGEDASLINAFIAFCHSNLAHNQPDRFGMEDVQNAFTSHPEIALQLVGLFRSRFDPLAGEKTGGYQTLLAETQQTVADYSTGHRY